MIINMYGILLTKLQKPYRVLVDRFPRISVDQRSLDLVESLIGVTLDGALGIAEDQATSVSSIDTSLPER